MKRLKKIELATYDVEEMNRQEQMFKDGGYYPPASFFPPLFGDWKDWLYWLDNSDPSICY